MIKLVRALDNNVPSIALFLRILKYELSRSPELQAMRSYLSKGDVVLDIGARRGLFTAFMARLVRPHGMVHAFEPFAENLRTLNLLFARNPCVTIHPVALSATSGARELIVPLEEGVPNDARGSLEDHSGNTGVIKTTVSCARLDDVAATFGRRVAFIKCDVEGHELEVFRGAQDLLGRDRPVCLVEIEERHASEGIKSRFNFFRSLGYQGLFLQRGVRPRPIEQFDTALHQSLDSLSGQSGGAYVNMFLFIPR